MTADIRTAAQREAEASIHVPVWFPAHDIRADLTPLARQHFVDGAVWGAARVTPTREQIAEALPCVWSPRMPTHPSEECETHHGPGRTSGCLTNADRVLAVLAGLAEGES